MRMILLAIFPLLIAGCGAPKNPESRPQDRHPNHSGLSIVVYDIDGPSGYTADHLIDTRLPDGTRCIIHYAGGIACDFSGSEVTGK